MIQNNRNLKKLLEKIVDKCDRRKRIHFLHIGKTAGTQLSEIARQINKTSREIRVVKQPHRVSLNDISDERYFFSIRKPETRFVSGFYSRKRKGQPRLNSEWSPNEVLAFNKFEHANELAEALSEPGIRGSDAFCAIKSIRHCSQNAVDWFNPLGFFLELRPPVYIVRQECFDQDLKVLLARLGVDFSVEVTFDPTLMHANDYDQIPDLSSKAKKNLSRWYSQDVELYKNCENWIASEIANH